MSNFHFPKQDPLYTKLNQPQRLSSPVVKKGIEQATQEVSKTAKGGSEQQIQDTLKSTEYGSVIFDSSEVNFPEKQLEKEAKQLLEMHDAQEAKDTLKNVTNGMKEELSENIGKLEKSVKQGFADGSIKLKPQPNYILPVEGFEKKSALGSKIDDVIQRLEKKVKDEVDVVGSDGTEDFSRSITKKTIESLKEFSKMEAEYELPSELLDKIKASLKEFPGGETPFDWINEGAPQIGIPILNDTISTEK